MSTSIQESAMVVVLKLSAWAGRKYDKAVSQDVARRNNATDDAGRYNKHLLAKSALQRINSVDNQIRTFHYKMTLPWLDDGGRIITTELYFDYVEGLQPLRDERDRAVQEFIAAYPDLQAAERRRLGSLYRKDDYPSVQELKRKFSMEVLFLPMPSIDDFRVSLNSEDLERLKADTGAQVESMLQVAVRDVWERIHETVQHMHERLEKYTVRDDGKVESPFRDSLVENMRELVGILPKLNFTGDAELQRMTERLEKRLCKYDPDELRQDEKAREKVSKEAARIMKDMKWFMQG